MTEIEVGLHNGESLASAVVRCAARTIATPRDLAREVGIVHVRQRTNKVAGPVVGMRADPVVQQIDWPSYVDYDAAAQLLHTTCADAREATFWNYFPRLGLAFPDLTDHLWRGRRTNAFWCVLESDRFCPLCLRRAPWFRIAWRVRPLTVCLEHAVLLADSCPGCGTATPLRHHLLRDTPVVVPEFFEDSHGRTAVRWPDSSPILLSCGRCGADLSKASAPPTRDANLAMLRRFWLALNGEMADADEPLSTPADFLGTSITSGACCTGLRVPALAQGRASSYFSVVFLITSRRQRMASCNVEDMHVLASAALAILSGWPTAFYRLYRQTTASGRSGSWLAGVRHSLPAPMTEELRRASRRPTRSLLTAQLSHYALYDRSTGPLDDSEWIRALRALWETRGNTGQDRPMVSTSLIDPGFLTLRGIAQLRAQVDLLLAAIEGDGRFSAVHTNARDTYLARFLRKWGGGFAPGQLLGELREIGLERRCELQGTPALFKRRRDATAGITDYAWLVARGHLPVLGLDSGCGGLGERTNTHSRGRPTPRRRTLEELLEGLCGGRTKRSDAVRLRIGPKILQIGEPEIWTAVRDLCGLSSRRVDHPTTITRPVLTTSTWDRGDLGSIFEPVRGKWSANMGERQILELFLDSWLTAESVITSTALARAGISRGPEGLIHYYIRRWRASGHLGRALQRACEVESEEPRRTFLSQVLAVVA